MLRENLYQVSCFLQGDTIWKEQEEEENLRHPIIDFEKSTREKRAFKEFARFLKYYLQSKRLHQHGLLLDAYTAAVEAIQHLGQIELLEKQLWVEEGMWEQLQSCNTASHKLFHELSGSSESLGQRIELALLAFEFSAITKMAESCTPLLRVLRGRKEPWSLRELLHKAEFFEVQEELPIVLRKLVYHSFIKQTTARGSSDTTGFGILYWI